jgi:hypothetical protein
LTEKIRNPAGNSDQKKPQRAGNPLEYEVIPGKRLVFVKFGKRVTQKGIARYAAALRNDPAFDPSFSEIVDVRQMEEMDMSGGEKMEVADKIDPFSLDAKRAFVVRGSGQAREARMYGILRLSKENFSIFQSIEEAELWIGKTVPKLRPE